ncbi:unnamed protein product [Mycena citricolor]|nr:unnamed protein product [Mycena citricolor]
MSLVSPFMVYIESDWIWIGAPEGFSSFGIFIAVFSVLSPSKYMPEPASAPSLPLFVADPSVNTFHSTVSSSGFSAGLRSGAILLVFCSPSVKMRKRSPIVPVVVNLWSMSLDTASFSSFVLGAICDS